MSKEIRQMINKVKNFKQIINEQVDYKTLQVGLKIKFKLKDGSENLGTIKQIFSDGVEAKLEKPRYDKSGNLISTSLVTMDTLTGVMFRDKWYTKEDFFNNFS
jgi:hypothetical protein